MAGRPEKALEPDGSARTDLAIRMRQVKGSVTFKEIAAKTAYTTGYLQQVFSATTAPSRPAIEACLEALEQDLSAWEPYIAAAVAGGPAVQEAAAGHDPSVYNSKSIADTPSAPPHEPSPASTAQVANGDVDEAPSVHADRSLTGVPATAGRQGQAIPDSATPSAAATQEQGDDGEPENADGSPSRPSRRVGVAVVVMLLVVGIIVVAAVVRSGSTTNSEATQTTPSPASVSGQAGSSTPGSDDAMSADAPILVTFDALGTTGTQVIQVYAGPGDSPEDRQVTGTYMSGMTAPVTCQARGRTIRSDTAAGEPDRTYDVWLRIDAPGPSQFATLTYTSLEPADLMDLPTCQ